jgi:hypothetical protein
LSGLGVLIATVMLLQISVVRRWNLSWPRLRITWGQAQLAMGAASFALVLIQLLIGAHMTVAGRSVSLGGRLGGVLGLFAAAGLAYGGFRASREPELNRVP